MSGVLSQLCYEEFFLLTSRVYLLPQNVSEKPLYTQTSALYTTIPVPLHPSRWWCMSETIQFKADTEIGCTTELQPFFKEHHFDLGGGEEN